MTRSIDVGDSIVRIMTTPLGTRVMFPTYGSLLFELVDRPVDEEWVLDAIRYTYDAVDANEANALVNRVEVIRGEDAKIVVYYRDLLLDRERSVGVPMSEVANAAA